MSQLDLLAGSMAALPAEAELQRQRGPAAGVDARADQAAERFAIAHDGGALQGRIVGNGERLAIDRRAAERGTISGAIAVSVAERSQDRGRLPRPHHSWFRPG